MPSSPFRFLANILLVSVIIASGCAEQAPPADKGPLPAAGSTADASPPDVTTDPSEEPAEKPA